MRRLGHWLLAACLAVVTVLMLPAAPAYANVEISGQAYNDENKNGQLNVGEAAVAGMTIDSVPKCVGDLVRRVFCLS